MNSEKVTTANRLARRFEQLKSQKRAALVTFITAGDPDPDTGADILHGLPAAGTDIIELGMPFSDPMADGPAIQLASLRALEAGMTLQKTLDMVTTFRDADSDTPIVLMGYYNPIYQYGTQKFIDAALAAGVDGLIIVDLPPEEDDELCHPCLTAGLNWIRLTTPTTDAARLPHVLAHGSGFVYHVAIAGVTGTRSAAQTDLQAAVAQLREHTDLPVAVGFGIKTPEQVAQVGEFADAVVVGSAIVNRIADAVAGGENGYVVVDVVHNIVRELSAGVKKARSY